MRVGNGVSYGSDLIVPSSLRCISSSKLVKYVIGAEFDNKVGSVIKHQLPKKIPGFKDNLQNLGELMISLNAEKKFAEDYTCFILYKDSKNKYSIFPDSDKDLYGSMSELQRLNIHEIGTIYENGYNHISDNESEISVDEEIDDILFFLSVTKTIKSESDSRGAKIRSIAIGTPLRNFIIFKHLITITIQSYINDGSITNLISLFNVINSTDISIWQKFISLNHQLHENLSLSYKFDNKLILSNFKNIPTNEILSQSIKFKNGVLQYFPKLESNDPLSSKLKLIPLNFNLNYSNDEILTDLNLNLKILKFFNQLSLKLNTIKYKNFNIIIYSNYLIHSSDFLCQFVLTLSKFLNGFDNAYFSNDKILYFPLIDLSTWESLLEFQKQSQNTKIIGTNNIILKDSGDEFYHFWYDLDDESLELNSKKLDLIDNKRLILNKNIKFQNLINELILKKHDSNTILLSLKKFNISEILKILKLSSKNDEELNIKDYYLNENKNLIIFNEFFEFKTIELIEKIQSFLIISKNENILKKIYDLLLIYKYFIQFISINDQNIGKLLFILEIYPVNDSSINDLIFDVKDIQLNKTENSLINLIFKFLLIKNRELQKLIFKLFEIINKSSFKLILDERLNIFSKILIEEYIATIKDIEISSSSATSSIKKKSKTKRKKTLRGKATKESKKQAFDNYI